MAEPTGDELGLSRLYAEQKKAGEAYHNFEMWEDGPYNVCAHCNKPPNDDIHSVCAAVAAEREACAKVANTHVTLAALNQLPMDSHQAARWLRSSIAAAIRARGKEQNDG